MCRVCGCLSVTVAWNQSATAMPVQFNVNFTTIHYLFNAVPHYSRPHSLSLSDALPRAHNNNGRHLPHSAINTRSGSLRGKENSFVRMSCIYFMQIWQVASCRRIDIDFTGFSPALESKYPIWEKSICGKFCIFNVPISCHSVETNARNRLKMPCR